MSEYDKTMIFMPLAEAQRYFSKASEVDVLEVVVDDPERVNEYATACAPRPARHQRHRLATAQRDVLHRARGRAQRHVHHSVADRPGGGLNIISGLMMLVKDKGRDIAILRTMGATKGAVMRVFLITGASIGIVGTLGRARAGRRVLLEHRGDPPIRVLG